MKIQQAYWHMGDNENMGEDNFKYCPLCGDPLIHKIIDKCSRRTCPSCGFIHFINPTPTVSLLIISENQVLLGKRSAMPGNDKWATPSGYIEFNEDFLTTAIREAKEETNLDVEIVEILELTDSFFPPENHFLNIYLLAKVISGLLKSGDDMGELRWFELDEPMPEMYFQEDIDVIEYYRKEHRYAD
jgi:ADP-ribose pyrophosphatase YjhB (NUDIX family)